MKPARFFSSLMIGMVVGSAVATATFAGTESPKRSAERLSDATPSARDQIYQLEKKLKLRATPGEISPLTISVVRLMRVTDRLAYQAKVYEITYSIYDLKYCEESM